MLSVLYSQYHACWCPGDFRSQASADMVFDPQSWNIPSLASEELTVQPIPDRVKDTVSYFFFTF